MAARTSFLIEENFATLNIEGKSRTSLSFPGSYAIPSHAVVCEIAQRTAQTFRERLFPSNGGKCKWRQVKLRSLKMDSLAFR